MANVKECLIANQIANESLDYPNPDVFLLRRNILRNKNTVLLIKVQNTNDLFHMYDIALVTLFPLAHYTEDRIKSVNSLTHPFPPLRAQT